MSHKPQKWIISRRKNESCPVLSQLITLREPPVSLNHGREHITETMKLKNRQVSAFFRFSTKCSISTLNKRASFTRIHEYLLLKENTNAERSRSAYWKTSSDSCSWDTSQHRVVCIKAPLTGNMFSQCYLYKNIYTKMKRGLRWDPAGSLRDSEETRFMSLGSVDHQTERHAAASCPARLWSVGGQTSETVIVGGGGPDVRPISSPHVQVFFSALFSSLFLHVWFIQSSRFIKHDVFWHSGHFLLYLLHLFIFVDIFFWQFFHWKYFACLCFEMLLPVIYVLAHLLIDV